MYNAFVIYVYYVFFNCLQVQSMGSIILIGVLSLFHLAIAQVTGMYSIQNMLYVSTEFNTTVCQDL